MKTIRNGFSHIEGTVVLNVEAWGKHAVRVRSFPVDKTDESCVSKGVLADIMDTPDVDVIRSDTGYVLTNGQLTVCYDGRKLSFFYENRCVLEEYVRVQSVVRCTVGMDEHIPSDETPSFSLNIRPREFTKQQAICRFEGDATEKIYGLGGYQEELFNKNGSRYELMHRNSQTSIPFYLSNKQYGFMWHQPAIGHVTFGHNEKCWVSNASLIDYVVIVGKEPKDILMRYMSLVGKPPVMNKQLLGLWQSKLRYQTKTEVENVYEQYVYKGIPLSVLVIDYYHWTYDGDFQFDDTYWQGIDTLAKKMLLTNTQLMVSLWPTVSENSQYYPIYQKENLLIESKSSKDKIFNGLDILDMTNDKTRHFVSQLIASNYKKKHIGLFWADQAEPEMSVYQHHMYQTSLGNFDTHASLFPSYYLKMIRLACQDTTQPILTRSAWFGDQCQGALVWTGDIDSSFASLKRQIQIGISMGLVGVSWITTDIGGFHSGDTTTPVFKELLIRWFQYATFSPILRMHGDRQPHQQAIGASGGGVRTSGSDNEIWSFGQEVEDILTAHIALRKALSSYLEHLYQEASEKGIPLMRALFLAFPDDAFSWRDTTSYMFGEDLLVFPITEFGIKTLSVHLPKDDWWIDVYTGQTYKGGSDYSIDIEIETIPVFCRAKAEDMVTLFKNWRNNYGRCTR